MKVYIHTLGCKVNQYESQALETVLSSRGHEIVSRDGDFDVFIVNTCAVTAESGRKSRQIIRQLKASHPDAVCAVCGCYSQISPGVLRPSAQECHQNPRARSTKLRWAVRA